jgi:hypothetical protein
LHAWSRFSLLPALPWLLAALPALPALPGLAGLPLLFFTSDFGTLSLGHFF